MRLGRLVSLLAWMAVAAMLASGCGRQSQSYEKSVLVMDTVATLSAEGPEAKLAVEESLQRLRELEAMADPQRPDSDVRRLREAAGKEYVPLHPEIYHLLEVSQEYSRRTQGAWDVTAGPLVELWGIGTDHARVPSAEELAEARSLVGWQKLHLNSEDKSAMLETSGMSVDLGGIAKGLALDEVRRIYERHGIENGLINLGASSLYAMGQKGGTRAWRIGIRHPRSEDRQEYMAVARLGDCALSTSGDYERCFMVEGRRFHHILDPRTGVPAESGVISDTIVIDGEVPDAGLLSDLLTTVVMLLGPEQGSEFLAGLPEGVQGALVRQDFKILTVHGFAGRLEDVQAGFPVE